MSKILPFVACLLAPVSTVFCEAREELPVSLTPKGSQEFLLKATRWLEEYVATIPDFPLPGIQFKWYSRLLKSPSSFKKAILQFADRYRDQKIDAIVALDSRGFIFGTALAYELELPLVLVRKAGKLPGDVISKSYELEYGKSTFELERGILSPGQKVVIVDDLIATGGTVCAAGALVESLDAEVVEVASLIELSALGGRSRIPYSIYSLLQVD